MMNRITFFIDGWFMRKSIMQAKTFEYTAKNIRRYCGLHLSRYPNRQLVRIFYYDTEPLMVRGHNPLTNKPIDFSKSDVAQNQIALLEEIKGTPSMALRLGKTIWRDNGWVINPQKMRKLLQGEITVDDLEEKDIKPTIEQKAVDMKIGIDITSYALKKLTDTLIVISGDADIVPALKQARREGLVVVLDPLRRHIQDDLKEHVDYLRTMFKEGTRLWQDR